MSDVPIELLDLELAWKRVKLDIPHRVFVRNPFEVQLLEKDLSSYLNHLTEKIQKDRYYPKSMYVCDVPKGEDLLRPGSLLSVEDRIVYYACLGACLPHIYDTLKWSQGSVEFSYAMSNDFENAQWLENSFVSWEKFRTTSLEKIDASVSHVILTDISGYYENIDIITLMSDLRSIGVHSHIVDLLSKCLNRWAQTNGRGIPQGYAPSDFLGKLYLNSVDLNLRAMGFEHLRYVDDIRIFCKGKVEARKALVELNKLLRRRGLNFQSAKTRICLASKARTTIDGIQPTLQPIIKDFIEAFSIDNPYFSVAQADELLEKITQETPVEVLRNAFRKHFIESNDESFDKTLFHFLVNRLGKSKDAYALDYCLTLLESHPEETFYILKYIKSVDAINQTEDSIVELLRSESAVYPYQSYQILEWFSEYAQNPSKELLAIARQIAFDKSQPKYLKAVSRKLIGEFGTSADLERLESLYSDLDDEIEKCEIICCLKNLEKTRRNSFLSRARHDGKLAEIASDLVKGGNI